MLTKIVAVWIVLLAASPYTQPFTTIHFDWSHRESARDHVVLSSPRSVSLSGVELDAVPTNPPVEVQRGSIDSKRPLSAGPTTHPGADKIKAAVWVGRQSLNQDLGH